MSEDKKAPQKKSRRRRPQKKAGASSRPNQGGTQARAKQENNSGNGQRSRRRSNQRNYNKKRRSSAQSTPRQRYRLDDEGKLMLKYWNLFEEYLNARKRYQGLSYESNVAKKTKAYNHYIRSLETWRHWQDKLSDTDREYLDKRSFEAKLENSYTTLNGIKHDVSQVDWEGPFFDQHFLKEQQEADFSKDTEESLGSFEDYQKMKEDFIPRKFRET